MPASSTTQIFHQIYVGIDIGTTGCRAIAIDKQAQILAEVSRKLSPPKRNKHRVTQDPLHWWQEVIYLINDLSRLINLDQIQAISIDGTSATLVLVDKNGTPLFPALMYNDARSQTQAAWLKQHAPLNCAAHGASSSLSKMLWCMENENLDQLAFIHHQADWIAAKFTGHYGKSDINNVIKLGYDAQIHSWPEWVKSILPINAIPNVVKPGQIVGNISKANAELTGLTPTTKIVAGTTDSTAAAIASGAKQLGQGITALGSTLVVKVVCDTPIFNAQLGIYSQPLFDQWLVGGASNSGGNVLRHYFSQQQIDQFSSQIQTESNTGFDYYPLIHTGERFPINDAHLTPRLEPRPDNDATFFQAILEGITRIEKRAYQLLHEQGAPYPTCVFTNGGGANNLSWNTIRQQYLKVPVQPAQHLQAAYGSALIAKNHLLLKQH